jgi:hypothetical protein
MNGIGPALAFWSRNNLWRTILYPILYIVIAILWRHLFSSTPEASVQVPVGISGGQCLLFATMSYRTGFEIFCVAMFIIAVVEVTVPSKINLQTPIYTDKQRVGWGLDSGAKCNRAKQTGFARLCQAL